MERVVLLGETPEVCLREGSHMYTWRRFVLIFAACLVAAACSADGVSDDDAQGPRQRGGDITVQLYQPPTTLSPLVASIGPIHLLNQLHWDSLLSVDADMEYGPRLAESWEVSEDGRKWTFHLRDDVRWSDGEPFTAADVVFTYELYANPATGSAVAGKLGDVAGAKDFVDGNAESISGLHAPDESTFVVELTEPNTAFIADLVDPVLFILPKHVVGQLPVEGLAENPFFREPTVGIGPYVFNQWVTDDQVELHGNPEYRQKLGLDRVFAQYVSTDVALAQLETGEIDYAQVSATDVSRVESLDGVTLHRKDGPGVTALHTAIDSGKLADKRVRQAIIYAIDREAIVDEALAGEGKVVDTLIHGPEWAMPDDLKHYAYDPGRAHELLAEAKWDSTTEVRIEIIPGQRDRDTTATIVAAQLQEVGMNAKVVQMEASQQAEVVANRDFDLLVSRFGMFTLDPAAMNARLSCGQIGGSNLTAYCNEDLDALLKAGIATSDQSERAEIYHDAQRIVNEEMPILVLNSPATLAATSDRLQGFELNPSPVDAFWNAAEWTVSS